MSFWNFLGLGGEEEAQKPPAPTGSGGGGGKKVETVAERSPTPPQGSSPGVFRTSITPSANTGGYAAPAVPVPMARRQTSTQKQNVWGASERSSSISSSVASIPPKPLPAASPSRFGFVNKPAASPPPQASGPSAFGFINRPPIQRSVAKPPPPPPPPVVARAPSSTVGVKSPTSSVGDLRSEEGSVRQSPRAGGGLGTEIQSSRKMYRDERTQWNVRRKGKLGEQKDAVLSVLRSASREKEVVAQLRDVLERQNRMVEEERYDEASDLDNEVASAREAFIGLWRGMANRAEQIKSTDTALRDLDEENKQMAVTRMRAVEEQMKELKSEKDNEFSSINNSRLKQQRDVLEADVKGLEEMKKANSAEEAEVKAARSSVEDAIKEVTSPIEEDKQRALDEKDEIDQTIDKLEKELAEMRKKREECLGRISGFDEQIEESRGKFSEELDNVKAGEERLGRKMKAMELKEEIIERQRKMINDEESEIDKRHEEKLECSRKLEGDIRELEKICDGTDRKVSWSLKLSPTIDSGINLILEGAQLRTKLRTEVKEVTEKLSSLDLEMSRVRSQLHLLQQRRPQIEEEKQQAIRSRMFGEAKNLSAEAKSLDESIASTEASLNSLRNQSAELREKLEEIQKQEDDLLDDSRGDSGSCRSIVRNLGLAVRTRLNALRKLEKENTEGVKADIEMMENVEAEIRKHLTVEEVKSIEAEAEAMEEKLGQKSTVEIEGKHVNEPRKESTVDQKPATELPTETKPATELPTETKPATELPTETKPATELPTETKPATELPTETKPATELPTETKPVVELPTETKPATELPTETKPVVELPTETKPATELPTESKPATELPTETKPVVELPTETKPATGLPTGTKPATGLPTGTKPATGLPTGTKPATGLPTGTKPATGLPTETKPATGLPTGTKPVVESAKSKNSEKESAVGDKVIAESTAKEASTVMKTTLGELKVIETPCEQLTMEEEPAAEALGKNVTEGSAGVEDSGEKSAGVEDSGEKSTSDEKATQEETVTETLAEESAVVETPVEESMQKPLVEADQLVKAAEESTVEKNAAAEVEEVGEASAGRSAVAEKEDSEALEKPTGGSKDELSVVEPAIETVAEGTTFDGKPNAESTVEKPSEKPAVERVAARLSDSSEGEALTSGDDIGDTNSCTARVSSNDDDVSPPPNEQKAPIKTDSDMQSKEVFATRDDILDLEVDMSEVECDADKEGSNGKIAANRNGRKERY